MGPVVLLIIFLLLVLVIVPIWVFIQIRSFREQNDRLRGRLASVEERLAQLQNKFSSQAASATSTPPTPASATLQPRSATQPSAPLAPPLVASVTPAQVALAPSINQAVPTTPSAVAASSIPESQTQPPAVPPPLARIAVSSKQAERRIAIDWEQFMGAKLFAWLGGLAGFLAVAYFVEYSFEHDLIPPEIRVALGFILSAGLIVGGLLIRSKKLHITAQVLCATGIVSLYAVTFACNAVYHFAFFGQLPTFLLMVLITVAAFLLAIRMNAQVVAILGLLGGFLTPILLSTGQDNPAGLFGFIALLDAGLIAVALHREWPHLIPLSAAGTVLMQLGWASKFFNAQKASIAVAICLAMAALYLIATEIARRWRRSSLHLSWSAATLGLVAFGFALFFQAYPSIAARPGLLFSFILVADIFLLTLSWREDGMNFLHALAGGLAFAVLAIWTGSHLTNALLSWALVAYLGFAILHTAFPVVLERVRPGGGATWWSQLYPPLALLLTLGPILKLETISLLFWPAVLVLDLVAIAMISASIAGLGIVLVLTLATAGLCIFKATTLAVSSTSLVLVIGGFAVFFFAAGLFLAKRIGDKLSADGEENQLGAFLGGSRAQIPAFSALLPFVLLVMMSQRLPLHNPAPLFGLVLLLTALVLGLTRLLSVEWLPACGLAGAAAVEYAWHARLFTPSNATGPLLWYIGFYAIYALYPFLFSRKFSSATGPWAVAALSGIVHFRLVYDVVNRTWPNDFLGVLPALFAVAPLVSLIAVLRSNTAEQDKRLNQLAWFGGAALFFITLVFPIQFERQWITIGWALEGAALLWLFQRVPHPGLRGTGFVLLVVAFSRLALNPAVLSYHVRAETPIFNWFFYAYGVTIICLFVGARLLAPPNGRVLLVNGPAWLNTLGTILTFLLLNIEIADYFSATGSTLTFQFAGNFARDLAYTVGWALFALALLSVGIWRQIRAARYAAIGLLSVTLLKLFFHDLAQLGQLYRVGALVAVAAVAIVASFLYQRFVPGNDRSIPPAA